MAMEHGERIVQWRIRGAFGNEEAYLCVSRKGAEIVVVSGEDKLYSLMNCSIGELSDLFRQSYLQVLEQALSNSVELRYQQHGGSWMSVSPEEARDIGEFRQYYHEPLIEYYRGQCPNCGARNLFVVEDGIIENPSIQCDSCSLFSPLALYNIKRNFMGLPFGIRSLSVKRIKEMW